MIRALEDDIDETIERHDTVIIGGGQAGLATGYHLARAGRESVILEASPRIGDSWRNRWATLRLFTPAEMDGLPGMRFPARNWTFPTKDEMAAYLERYAAAFGLAVRTGTRVKRLTHDGRGFVVETDGARYEAANVVVATGADHAPRIPDFALDLDAGITQLHSSEYRDPATLRPGEVLIVGAGNSGTEIAIDIGPTRRTWLSGRYRRPPVGLSRSPFMTAAFRPLITHLLTIDTPMGRAARAGLLKGSGGVPVERVTLRQLARAGVELVPRVDRVSGGRPMLADGRTLDVANVIWCTGYAPGLEWVDLPVHDERGEARQTRGVATDVEGLFFVGRLFQYSVLSATVGGVGRDAAYIAERIARRSATRSTAVESGSARA